MPVNSSHALESSSEKGRDCIGGRSESTGRFFCLFDCLSVCLSVCLFVCLFVFVSVFVFVCVLLVVCFVLLVVCFVWVVCLFLLFGLRVCSVLSQVLAKTIMK